MATSSKSRLSAVLDDNYDEEEQPEVKRSSQSRMSLILSDEEDASDNRTKDTERQKREKKAEPSEEDGFSLIRQRQKKAKENAKTEEKKEKLKKAPKAKHIPTEEEIDLSEQEKDIKREHRWRLSTRILNIFLVSLCVYIVFLIYGVIVTQYQYDDSGKVSPQVMSVEDIKEEKDFEVVLGQYERCRLLYEKTLMLDYRLGQGVEDPMTIAPEYEALLEQDKTVNVNDLSIKTDALTVNTKYAELKSMMLNWIQNDIALYLQNISAGISQNNSEAAANALTDRDAVYNDFSVLTSNIVTIGENIKGVDITEIKSWSPDSYVDEQVNGEEN